MAEHLLQVGLQQQCMTEWCWAAVTIAVAEFYSDSDCGRQCDWVSAITTIPGCCDECSGCPCTTDPSSAYNQTHDVGDSLQQAGHLKGAASEGITPSLGVIAHEVDSGHPVVGVIDWNDGDSHVVLLYGYADGGLVHVGDPEKPGTVQTMSGDFIYSPGGDVQSTGRCNELFLTQAKENQ